MVNKPHYGWTQESYPEREDVAARFPDAAFCRQVHGVVIHYADRPGFYGDGDGLFTDKDGVMLTVRTADCNGIVLWDDEKDVVMVLHAGWKGTAQGILEHGIALFQKRGIKAQSLNLFFAPSARKCCYEVGEEIVGEFRQNLRGFIEKHDMKLFADLVGMNINMAEQAGIVRKKIITEPHCTICNESLFSYRRSKTTKRHVVFVRKG